MSRILNGKVIIVTGCGGGIGTGSCGVLADAGASLVISDVSEEAGSACLEMIRERGGQATLVKADIASEASIENLVEITLSLYGRLDGAFNNAGVEQGNIPLAELTLEQWEQVIGIDLTGVFLCMKYQILAMLESGGGSIVNTSSSLGQVAIPNAADYIAAKHGVIGLTRAAAADYGTKGIRVNAILPGIIRTPMIERLSRDPQLTRFFDRQRSRHLMDRFGESTEIGEAAKWLLSDEASFVNGVAFPVDGGYLAN
jgi:NAD(P)-dependent dehydrogenase (short-subunit alcohol dehydrogenase family)